MATIELDSSNLAETIHSNDTVIVDFWAPWCGPCRSFGPIYEEVSEQHSDIVFAKVNTEQHQDIAAHFNIRSIPTLMVFREQIILYAEAGALPKQGLLQLIEQVQGLDMDEVRKSIEQDQAQG